MVGSFVCDALAPCRNVTLQGVQLRLKDGKAGRFVCKHAFGAADGSTSPMSCLQ